MGVSKFSDLTPRKPLKLLSHLFISSLLKSPKKMPSNSGIKEPATHLNTAVDIPLWDHGTLEGKEIGSLSWTFRLNFPRIDERSAQICHRPMSESRNGKSRPSRHNLTGCVLSAGRKVFTHNQM
mmetsp:Transcript_37065/g.72805  ORF Transcript_37065/g.72805 Transcript_37065/m.72805 type:complete len:124 (+) Transcript_37065:721-1092(+)